MNVLMFYSIPSFSSMQEKNTIFFVPGSLSTYAPEPEFVGDIPSIKVVAGKDATLRCVVENLGNHKVFKEYF